MSYDSKIPKAFRIFERIRRTMYLVNLQGGKLIFGYKTEPNVQRESPSFTGIKM